MNPTIRIDGEPRFGRALDLRDTGLTADTVAAAIRGEEVSGIEVRGGEPGQLFDRTGVIRPGMALDRRGTLAAVARSLGRRAPQADERAQVEASLASLPDPDVGFAAVRKRAATAGRERDRLRERVATLRGRIQALRDQGADDEAVIAELRSAAQEFSEAETERAAAMQALARERRRAREQWDVRERRLAHRDRLDNLDRAARAWLADSVRESVDRAVGSLPVTDATGIEKAPADVVALASLRVATVRAPVVLACDRFSSVEAAADWLDAPVLRVEV